MIKKLTAIYIFLLNALVTTAASAIHSSVVFLCYILRFLLPRNNSPYYQNSCRDCFIVIDFRIVDIDSSNCDFTMRFLIRIHGLPPGSFNPSSVIVLVRNLDAGFGSYCKLRTQFFPLGFMAQAWSTRAINPSGENEDLLLTVRTEKTRLVRYLSYLWHFAWRLKQTFEFSGPYSGVRPAKLTNHSARTNWDI